MEDTMRRIGIAVALMMLLAPLCATAQVANDNFIFPVVVRAAGAANTMWKTEMCVTNPWNTPLVLAGGFVQGGTAFEGLVEFSPGMTYCSQDLIAEWLGVDTWAGAFYLWAVPEYNTNANGTAFAAIGKVYNDTPAGTFGTTVPVGQYVPAAWSMGYPLPFGLVSGLHNWGTPGVNGFRTSVGIFNPADFTQEIIIEVVDSEGYIIWSKTLNVPALTFIQVAAPKKLQFANAAGWGTNNGGTHGTTIPVIAYATVVDNRTGDGVFKSAMIFYENNLKKMSTEEIEAAQEEHMRKIFAKLLKQENPQIRRAGERMVPLP
jgi:hypothetical protein